MLWPGVLPMFIFMHTGETLIFRSVFCSFIARTFVLLPLRRESKYVAHRKQICTEMWLALLVSLLESAVCVPECNECNYRCTFGCHLCYLLSLPKQCFKNIFVFVMRIADQTLAVANDVLFFFSVYFYFSFTPNS